MTSLLRSVTAVIALALIGVSVIAVVGRQVASASACAPPAQDYGSTTNSVTVSDFAVGSYNVWARMAAPDTSNNTFLLEIDGTECFVVGGSSIPRYDTAATNNRFVNDSTNWTNKTSSGTAMQYSFTTAGVHTIKIIGNAPGVLVDRVILTQASPASCTPTASGDNCANPPDITKPVVNLTSPISGSQVNSPLTVGVNATDDTLVTKVELYKDNDTIPTAIDTTAPFNGFNAVGLTAGAHSVFVRAYDAAGNVGQSSTTPFTIVDTSSPTVTLTNPVNGSAVAGTITLAATAADDVALSKVEFLIDATVIGQVSTAPYTITYNTAATANGTHTITARAVDSSGNIKATVATVTVNNAAPPALDTIGPTVLIASTNVFAKPIAGRNFIVNASASDASGVKSVEFLLDGKLVNTSPGGQTAYNFALDTTTLTSGTHTFFARATDSSTNQNKALTPTITIKITDVADVNRDCRISGADFTAIIPGLTITGDKSAYDVNGDGRVSGADFTAVIPKLNGPQPCTL